MLLGSGASGLDACMWGIQFVWYSLSDIPIRVGSSGILLAACEAQHAIRRIIDLPLRVHTDNMYANQGCYKGKATVLHCWENNERDSARMLELVVTEALKKNCVWQ